MVLLILVLNRVATIKFVLQEHLMLQSALIEHLLRHIRMIKVPRRTQIRCHPVRIVPPIGQNALDDLLLVGLERISLSRNTLHALLFQMHGPTATLLSCQEGIFNDVLLSPRKILGRRRHGSNCLLDNSRTVASLDPE
jgi:hypothetical protein